MKDADEFYKPKIKENIQLDGIAAGAAEKDSAGPIFRKGFMMSLQSNFVTLANNLMRPFSISRDSINKVLIIIKNDNTAKIYSIFPLSIQVRAKKDIKTPTFVTKDDVFDISALEFKDEIFEINIEEDDKIIYLFRVDWKFGLYFDFTKKLNVDNLKKELANCYQRLFYYNLYAFVENKSYFNNVIEDGWFPFIQLIGNDFNQIIRYYEDGKEHNFQIDDLINKFTQERINSFTQYWWKNKTFLDKKEIIDAGIKSFLQNDKSGFITCLHTLYPQIEGIVGLMFFKDHKKKLSSKKLIEYIKDKSKSKFSTVSSTGFPNEFCEYLTKTVFENFDISTGKLDLSRHTTAHGYADSDDFNKAKALQAILILDQIHFYFAD